MSSRSAANNCMVADDTLFPCHNGEWLPQGGTDLTMLSAQGKEKAPRRSNGRSA